MERHRAVGCESEIVDRTSHMTKELVLATKNLDKGIELKALLEDTDTTTHTRRIPDAHRRDRRRWTCEANAVKKAQGDRQRRTARRWQMIRGWKSMHWEALLESDAARLPVKRPPIKTNARGCSGNQGVPGSNGGRDSSRLPRLPFPTGRATVGRGCAQRVSSQSKKLVPRGLAMIAVFFVPIQERPWLKCPSGKRTASVIQLGPSRRAKEILRTLRYDENRVGA